MGPDLAPLEMGLPGEFTLIQLKITFLLDQVRWERTTDPAISVNRANPLLGDILDDMAPLFAH